jgi:hypothetical protein
VLHDPGHFDRGGLGRLRRALTGAGGDDGHGGVICIDRPPVGNPAAALNEEPVVSARSITLGEAAEHTAVLTVACTRCDRVGQYRLDTLIARHGEGFGIPKLLRLLSKDCVKRASVSAYDLCGVHCPELPGFFLGEED